MLSGFFKKPYDQSSFVNEPKGLVFKGGEPTITTIKIYQDDIYIGSIEKYEGEFVLMSYGIINYNTCVKISEKLKELNNGTNI